MLNATPVSGRRVLLTAAASSCGRLLAEGARRAGAVAVSGIVRSDATEDLLVQLGVKPLVDPNLGATITAARQADVVFDAVGGSLAETLLVHLPPSAVFVSYGLLSEHAPTIPAGRQYRLFHLRGALERITPLECGKWFEAHWPNLTRARLPDAEVFPMVAWRNALAHFGTPGRLTKPVLQLGPAC
jgi:NADPH:quinone reductase-like Zn-dependent oxidoreductase